MPPVNLDAAECGELSVPMIEIAEKITQNGGASLREERGPGLRSGLAPRLEGEMREEVVQSELEPRFSEPISPELVLVDPELAQWARRHLPEPPRWEARAAARAPAPALAAVSTPSTEQVALPAKRGRRLALQLGIATLATVAVVLAIVFAQRLDRSSIAAEKVEQTPRGSTPLPSVAASGESAPGSHPADHSAGGASSQPLAAQQAPLPRHRSSKSPPATRTFRWFAVRGATLYWVQLFRSGRRVFDARLSEPRLVLPTTWGYEGRRAHLSPGRYRLVVRPGLGPPSSERYGRRIFSAWFNVQPAGSS